MDRGNVQSLPLSRIAISIPVRRLLPSAGRSCPTRYVGGETLIVTSAVIQDFMWFRVVDVELSFGPVSLNMGVWSEESPRA